MNLKTKPILLIAFVLLTCRTLAHQDIVYAVDNGNIHLEYLSGWSQYEIGNKIKIFVELSYRLIKDKFKNSDKLYVYFGHDYTKTDTSYYGLGYGQFWDFEMSGAPKKNEKTGIKIIIRDRDFDIKRMLLLVNSAFSNVDFIKKNQAKYVINARYTSDTLSSIPFPQIRDYLFSSDPAIESLLNQKVYRSIQKVKEGSEIDYYFQNNQFHFYGVAKSEKEKLGKPATSRAFEKDILTVSDIFEIIGSVNDGHLVFVTDSTFYFIPQLKDTVRGPFKIDSIKAGRPPIFEYHRDHRPILKFTLVVNNYSRDRKVFFIPDSNRLISNYNKSENELSKGLSKKVNEKKMNTGPNKTILFLTMLGLSLFLIIWLIKRIRN